MPDLTGALAAIQHSGVYRAALIFFAAYPIVTSIMWITTSLFFRARWEGQRSIDRGFTPSVSVLIAAHNEEAVIASTVAAVCRMDYPDYEVVVVDDGSTDGTREAIEPFVRSGQVRLLAKERNEGKAMALNDALLCLNGDIVLVMDADAEPESLVLRHIVPHFRSARVAAVTGNPRVKNVDTFLCRLQLIEFTSIVSLLRRSQRIWGRIVTVSGVVTAFRRAALADVGGFSPDMPTEDIELTWRLQKRFWDVRYEPKAIIWMTVPSRWRDLFRQRLRWARGLMAVLRRHGDVGLHWRWRRMWPMFAESTLSTLWAVDFVLLTSLWAVSYAFGYPPVGAHPIPNVWGMIIATLCLVQLFTGTWIDRKYDRDVIKYFPYAVYYPIVYWMFQSVVAVLAMPYLFRRASRRPVRWNTPREQKA